MAITVALFEYASAKRLSDAQQAYDNFMTATVIRKTSVPLPFDYVRDLDLVRKALAREKRRHARWSELQRVAKLP